MLSILAAAALIAQAERAAVTSDPDFRCLAVTAIALDGAPKESSEDFAAAAGLTAIFMYYLGRIDERYPSLDFIESFNALDRTPDFANGFAADAHRCSAEAEKRGQALQSMGRDLQQPAPPEPGRAG